MRGCFFNKTALTRAPLRLSRPPLLLLGLPLGLADAVTESFAEVLVLGLVAVGVFEDFGDEVSEVLRNTLTQISHLIVDFSFSTFREYFLPRHVLLLDGLIDEVSLIQHVHNQVHQGYQVVPATC